ncbi:MAG: hypothetical protein IPM52_05690 [Bacteroidetes bacterium]|nr:hypothetical protein [Bacteroidota bacterium]
MQKIFAWFFILLIILYLSVTSCKSGRNRFDIDQRELPQVSLIFRDFSSALFEADTARFAEYLRQLQPDFLPFLNANLEDTANINRLKNFVADTLARRLYHRTKEVFSRTNTWKSQLETSFRRFRYHFPEIQLPEVYTFISNVQPEQAVMVGSGELLVALDCFLGADEAVYSKLGIPRYMAAKMTPAHLVPAIWSAMYEAHIEDRTLRTRVLDEMIASGRKYLFMEAMMPDLPDHILFGVEPEKMRWLEAHEGEIWLSLVSEGLLYSSEPVVFRKLLSDGPFTAEFSYDSPARIGEWVGWQIMRSYAQQQSQKPLQALLTEGDAQTILSLSRYKPKR